MDLNNSLYFTSIFIVILLPVGSLSFQKGNRRAINGHPFRGRPNTYSAIRFYGVIASKHEVPWYTLGFRTSLIPSGVYGKIFCSGSLLTPAMFQTACHCVADFDKNSRDFIKRPFVKNSWENIAVVYVGVSNRFGRDSMVSSGPILTKKFIFHVQCGRIGLTESATYDYGVVELNSNWWKVGHDKKFPWSEISWAPAYKTQAMFDFYKFTLQQQLVCLFIGFGAHKSESSAVSEVLRHGWATLIPQTPCIQITTRIKGITNDFRKTKVTWVCTKPFPKYDQRSGGGDSGGPLTCQNIYFGVVSGTTRIRDDQTREVIEEATKHHALIHNLEVNSIEYREALKEKFPTLFKRNFYDGNMNSSSPTLQFLHISALIRNTVLISIIISICGRS